MHCLIDVAYVLWTLGYPDQAFQRMHEALTLARELAHPWSLVLPLCFAATLHQWRREVQATQKQAEAAVALSREQGFAFYVAFGTMLRGWALSVQEQGEEGITQIRQGLTAWRATGAES